MPNVLIGALAAVAVMFALGLGPKRSRSSSSSSSSSTPERADDGADCPSLTELTKWANEAGLSGVAVTSASDMLAPDEVWRRIGEPARAEVGWTRRQFFDQFFYFVQNECRFYTTSPSSGRTFDSDPDALADFRAWQRGA